MILIYNIMFSKIFLSDSEFQVLYDPNFAIRGLHYDVEKGLFLKVCNVFYYCIAVFLKEDQQS